MTDSVFDFLNKYVAIKINASAELSLALRARPKINADARYFDLNNRKTERITKNVGMTSSCV